MSRLKTSGLEPLFCINNQVIVHNFLHSQSIFKRFLRSVIGIILPAEIENFHLVISKDHKADESVIGVSLNFSSGSYPPFQLPLTESLLQDALAFNHVIQCPDRMCSFLHNFSSSRNCAN